MDLPFEGSAEIGGQTEGPVHSDLSLVLSLGFGEEVIKEQLLARFEAFGRLERFSVVLL